MSAPPSTNPALLAWVKAVAQHTKPQRVRWCTGTNLERAEIAGGMVDAGHLIKLDQKLHPQSFLYRTRPTDLEPHSAFKLVSTNKAVDVGPTSRWISRDSAHSELWPLLRGSMRGRTMYVVPYALGPLHSAFTSIGIEITDSPYVVLALGLMTRMGRPALERLGDGRNFFRGLHCMGDGSAERRFLVHFPDFAEVWSFGSGNAPSALLSRKSHALRIASVQAREQGWLAEHMSLLSVTSPEGQSHYIAAVASSAAEKAELASLPNLPGWKIEVIGGDSCWMRPASDGRLWAINPESGVSGGVASVFGDSAKSTLESLSNDVLFTDVALREGGRVWWEGLAPLEAGEMVEDFRGAPWTPNGAMSPAARPGAGFMVARRDWAHGSACFERVQGVPISAILFCGGEARALPLVYEARSWRHGVFVGAALVKNGDGVAPPRNDPMGMRDFCGYNVGDYLDHWLSVGRKLNRPPKFFHVNWFRAGVDGRRLWPGGGENIRVVKWIVERVNGSASARNDPLGYVPTEDSFEFAGLDLSQDRLLELLTGNQNALLRQADRSVDFLGKFREQLPAPLLAEHRSLVRRLQESLH